MEPGSVITPKDESTEGSAVNAPAQPAPATQQVEQSFATTGFDEGLTPEQSGQALDKVATDEVQWTASEYIAHQKNSNWFFMLGLGTILLTALVFFITKDRFTTGVIPVVAILFGVFAARQPQVLTYRVHSRGIDVAQRGFPYEDFRSFSIFEHHAVPSIFVWPTKRFSAGLTMYLPPDQADQIIDTLSLYLPHEEREPDPVDSLMRRLRF